MPSKVRKSAPLLPSLVLARATSFYQAESHNAASVAFQSLMTVPRLSDSVFVEILHDFGVLARTFALRPPFSTQIPIVKHLLQ